MISSSKCPGFGSAINIVVGHCFLGETIVILCADFFALNGDDMILAVIGGGLIGSFIGYLVASKHYVDSYRLIHE